MTNEEFFYAHLGERVLYKGKDIGAYVAGYIEDKYIILGFDNYTGCILYFTSKVYKTLGKTYNSYRFAKLKYFGSNRIIRKGRAKALPLLVI